jgi:hypothetical protein
MGIEPTSEAWEASILPLYDARSEYKLANPAHTGKSMSAKYGDSFRTLLGAQGVALR